MYQFILLPVLFGVILISGLNVVYGETLYGDSTINKSSEIITAYGNISVDNTESMQWINFRQELVIIHTTSVDRLFERGYLVDLELYLEQKNNLNIRIFDPLFRSQPMTEAESQLLSIPNPNDVVLPNEKPLYVIPPNAGELGEEHVHASILVKIFGDKFDFSKAAYQIKSSWIHLEGQDGDTIHRHASGVTLGFLFESMGIGLDEICYVFPDERQFCTNDDYSLRFYINDEQVETITNHVIMERDRILILFGGESADDVSHYLDELNSQKIIG